MDGNGAHKNEEQGNRHAHEYHIEDSSCGIPSLVYFREISVRYSGPRRKTVQISSPAVAAEFLRGVLKDNAREHFMALFLDSANQAISYATVSIGTANYTRVHPRELFQAAILSGSVYIIVAHNHPSGTLKPSQEDGAITRQLVSAGWLLDIPVIDHLILSDTDFFSFYEAGQME